MRSRWTTSTAVSLLSAATIACGDSTGPDPQDLVDILLDFCSTETPVFLAHQNQGDDWTRVSPDAAGTFAFQAAEQFTLAIVHQFGNGFSTEYVFATPADVQSLSGVSCMERSGSKAIGGSVANVPAGSAAMVTMAGAFDYVVAPASDVVLSGLPSGPLDVVAHREVVGLTDVVPDRVIIRRAQDRTNGSTLPTLDFGGAEARNVATHSFSATGLSAGDDNHFLLSFNTSTTPSHSLSTLVGFTSGSQSLYGVPGGLTQAGDYHALEVFADAGTSYRGEAQYYRVPSIRTVALGAQLNTPVLTTVATSPQLRLRTQLASQAEYGGLVTVAYVQGQRDVVLTATSAYFGGTPNHWDLTIPDLSSMPGFPQGALLQGGAGTDWYVDAYGGSGGPAAFFDRPVDGAVLRYAGRTFSTNAMQLSRTRGAERLSPHTRRRGLGVR